MMNIPNINLYNGIEMPAIGIGTHQAQGDAASDSLAIAFNEGYRLVDTAAAYLTEPVVREAIKKSDVKREDIFITSKLRNACHGYKNTMEAFELTLENLGTDYLDLYLIHWPNPVQYRTIWQQATKDTWKAFVELYNSGRIRAIGVSNFMPHHIDMVTADSGVLPMVNQLKLCPGVVQPEIVKYCKEKGIVIEAYSPFGTGTVFKAPELAKMSEKYGKSVGQIVLRWAIQMGFVPLPKSVTEERIRQNLNVFDFQLTEEDVNMISNLEGYADPAAIPDEIRF